MLREEKTAGDAILLLAAVSGKVPPYWRCNPAARFRQMEAQFTLAGVITDATRFNHAPIDLDEETNGLVTDVPEDCSYVRLKNS